MTQMAEVFASRGREEPTAGVISSRAKINFTFMATKTNNINLWAKLSPVLGVKPQDVSADSGSNTGKPYKQQKLMRATSDCHI
jgi:hypothetical protein